MNRRSSLGAMAAMLFCGPTLKQVAANQSQQISVIDVQKCTITELPKGCEAIQPLPIRRVMFEGAHENESGLTLRFGTGIESTEFVFTGMKPLSIATAKKLSNLTGTDAGPDAIMAVITE